MVQDTQVCSVVGCDRPVRCRGWCHRHYARWQRHGHVEPTRASGILHEMFTPTVDGSCWIWQGSFNSYGYGRIGINGQYKMAHRVIYEQHKGPIPEGLDIDHLCRTPACVNPDHLEPVTAAVNVQRGLCSYAIRTMCKNGLHDITHPSARYVNTYGKETCLECKRANDRRGEAKRVGKRYRGR